MKDGIPAIPCSIYTFTEVQNRKSSSIWSRTSKCKLVRSISCTRCITIIWSIGHHSSIVRSRSSDSTSIYEVISYLSWRPVWLFGSCISVSIWSIYIGGVCCIRGKGSCSCVSCDVYTPGSRGSYSGESRGVGVEVRRTQDFLPSIKCSP